MAQSILSFWGSHTIETNAMDSPDTYTTPGSNIFAAFGAVLGYIGAEAANIVPFERLLWPQRFFSGFTVTSVPAVALLMPMGGPMQKAALESLDVLFTHGLLKGPRQGHMLGTAFYRHLDWTYTLHGDGKRHKSHSEPIRNCLWARVLSNIEMPTIGSDLNDTSGGKAEKGATVVSHTTALPALRAQVAVSHLTISRATAQDKTSKLPFISEGNKTPSVRVILAICISELTAILTTIGVFTAWKSFWAILWLIPIFLRLISAFFAVNREPLLSASSAAVDDPACDLEIHCPQSEGNFMLITGPPTLTLQFVRHYGHPVRNRFRELVQLVIIVAFGLLFPVELFCSVIWMPIQVQYVWLSYQLYVVLAMHVGRYSYIGRCTTTEAKIAEQLGRDVTTEVLNSSKSEATREWAILFGQTRDGHGTLKVSVAVTYHNRYKEGKECMERLLRRHEPRATTPEDERSISRSPTI